MIVLGSIMLASLRNVSAERQAPTTDTQLVKQSLNALSSLISVPFENDIDFRIGAEKKGWRYTLQCIPVIPVSLNKDWNLITRMVVPFIDQTDVFAQPSPALPTIPSGPTVRSGVPVAPPVHLPTIGRNQTGLGDIPILPWFSPEKPGPGGWIWGVGPAVVLPTATNPLLGSEKWSAGPTFIITKQQGPWTFGLIADQVWSFAGTHSHPNVSQAFVYPYIFYTTQKKTTFAVDTESTYDWFRHQWIVPINAEVAQFVRIFGMPLNLAIGGRVYADGPSGNPEWGLRFTVQAIFPRHPR